MRRGVCWCLLSLALLWSRVEAHHSITGAYDLSREMTIEGSVTKFEFVNPHPVLTIDVVSQEGNAEPWRLEMDNRSELAAIGVTTQTFKPGDLVVVAGSPARSQPRGLYLLKLERPADGFGYEQVGGSPRIRSRSR